MGEKMEIYTLDELADMMATSRRTLYGLMKEGVLQGFKVGRAWRFTREQIEDFISRQTGRPEGDDQEDRGELEE